jgi:uncharacterized protein
MNTIFEILYASWTVFREAAFYILLGFLVAGLMRAYLHPDMVAHLFHRGRFRSVLYAALVGVPIPL